MFNIPYRCPRTVARHENGPLHESRCLYLEHLAAQGAALHTLRGAKTRKCHEQNGSADDRH
jgi:hypothetical protein